MRRDMSLLRQRLLEVDRLGESVVPENDPEKDRIQAHHEMAAEAKLAWIENGTRRLSRLTWEGRDFVDLARDDSAWAEAETRIMENNGGAPFEVWKWLLSEIHKRRLSR